ncbi:MAG TPA: phenylacetate--CoA ligase family protein, partial [Deltaproteobacteria bacterium]|nr:phenylacetate--CoA ligase family protein [Deltaproteobacteria bacterium]HQQ14429.1 phenylacetate--CoA ligase family protein [Deltaproteobacteria bacterium]
QEEFGIDSYQMYGATEVGDIAYECREKDGWHLCEEVVVEIVDPETGENLPPGALGEVVVTRLNSVFFLFRFGTGDLSSIREESCPCGRASRMLNGIAGRLGDAVKVRGMFVAPSQLKRLAGLFGDVRFQLVVTRSGHKDHLLVKLETDRSDDALHDLIGRFEAAFREICTVKIDAVEPVSPGSLEAGAPSIVDRRIWK